MTKWNLAMKNYDAARDAVIEWFEEDEASRCSQGKIYRRLEEVTNELRNADPESFERNGYQSAAEEWKTLSA